MQIVIDINDNEYLGIKNYPDNITSYPVTIHLYEAVRNGIPLPKGHTRLIEADKLDEQRRIAEAKGIVSANSSNKFGMMIIEAETIIEADTESEEEK